MDINFNCPKCDVDLAVDASGAGSAINCPACGEPITIPGESTAPPPLTRPPSAPIAPPPVAATSQPSVSDRMAGHLPVNAMASSAAAKVERHFSVPTSNKPVVQLVSKRELAVEAPTRETETRVRVKTIRHSDCIEVGHDIFDQVVSDFITKVGHSNVISIAPVNYTHTEHGGDRLVTDFGLIIVYRG